MGEIGGDAKMGRGGSQSGGNVLQGDDTGGTTICLGYLVPINGNGEDGGGDVHWIYEKVMEKRALKKADKTWVNLNAEVVR